MELIDCWYHGNTIINYCLIIGDIMINDGVTIHKCSKPIMFRIIINNGWYMIVDDHGLISDSVDMKLYWSSMMVDFLCAVIAVVVVT